ncbi:MAG: hypothetical protein LBI02_06560 [Opitutaceae bacterium]|jgi:hypothetical protein|nr:hypothetical protein [Opitutaceae bacterium]
MNAFSHCCLPCPGSISENARRRPGFVFRRDVVRDNRARSVLATSGGRGLIRDNDIVATRPAPVFKITPKQPGQTGETTAQAPCHRNIRIEENRIATVSGRLFETRRVAGLHFASGQVCPVEAS